MTYERKFNRLFTHEDLMQRRFSRILTIRCYSLIPESFQKSSLSKEERAPSFFEEYEQQPEYPVELQTFHEKVAGGFNGHFAELFDKRADPSATIKLHERLIESGIKISNRLTYNYLINAYLREKQHEKAFQLIVEMEKQGIQPDRMTFEIILREFSLIPGLELAVEELFVGMQKKWGIIGGPLAWTARISVWVHRKTSKRALGYYRHFVNADNFKTVDPSIPKMASVHVYLLKLSVVRQCWPLASEIMAYIKQNNIHISILDLQNIAELPSYLIEEEGLPMAVFLAESLKEVTLEEGFYCKILYFASRCGRAGSGLANLAMDKLTQLYASDGERASIPGYYLEAYVDMVESPKSGSSLSEKTKKRYQTYKTALKTIK
jgi:pentatricopeptide repeat protein